MSRPTSRPPAALADHAADQLAFIRDTMVRAGRFTAVSGAGTIGAGVVGMIATLLSPYMANQWQWLGLWLTAATVAMSIAVFMIARKAMRSGQSLRAGPGRTFALAFAPPLIAGGFLTAALAAHGAWSLLPGTWLVCYGAAVVSGGAFSVRTVPVFGAVLLVLGALAFLLPAFAQVWLLGAGFGAAHLLFGYFIARYHGG
ncbi:MAG: hypothetical protein HYV19_10675 [Gemmatimonadetes bacterium]|nr:hypothetical protein [Gemmatimonadota bacterium]